MYIYVYTHIGKNEKNLVLSYTRGKFINKKNVLSSVLHITSIMNIHLYDLKNS